MSPPACSIPDSDSFAPESDPDFSVAAWRWRASRRAPEGGAGLIGGAGWGKTPGRGRIATETWVGATLIGRLDGGTGGAGGTLRSGSLTWGGEMGGGGGASWGGAGGLMEVAVGWEGGWLGAGRAG